MKTTKRRFEQFLFYDYTGIERHLAKMAAKGWQLHKITRLYWEYRFKEPRKITYAVTYFSEASEFNPYPTENQQTFYEYCKESRWELAAEWAQMQIFCTEKENPTPIETEESVKLKSIHRAMKKNFLPSNILLLLVSIFFVILQLHAIVNDPVYFLSDDMVLLAAAMGSILVIYMLIILIGYSVWYSKSRKAIRIGVTFIASNSGYKIASCFIWLLLGITIITAALLISSQHFGWGGILGIANITILIALVLIIKKTLKRVKASKRVSLTVTMFSCVFLSFILTSVMVWSIFRIVNGGWFDKKPYEIYTTVRPNGSTLTWNIFHDPLPLKVEDLQAVDYGHYSYEWTVRESFLLAQFVARQNSFPDGQNVPELRYEIVEVKLRVLFDLCLNDYLNKYKRDYPEEDKRSFRKTDDPTWAADAVYQLYRQDEAMDEYILCWDNQIVYIDFNEIPTPGQIAVVVGQIRNN